MGFLHILYVCIYESCFACLIICYIQKCVDLKKTHPKVLSIMEFKRMSLTVTVSPQGEVSETSVRPEDRLQLLYDRGFSLF